MAVDTPDFGIAENRFPGARGGAAHRLRPLAQESRPEKVQNALAALIQSAGLQPGDRLPAERSLAEQLCVSRPTVREAMRNWQAMGLVEMRVGSGTYLRQQVGPDSIHVPVTFQLERRAVMQALELRRAIETDAARLAAVRADAATLARIEAALVAMETVYARHGVAIRQDKTFHEEVYRASGNPLYLQIYRDIITRIADAFNATTDNPFVVEPFTDLSQPDHRRLHEAIAARDPEGAAAAVARILDFVERTLREGGHG